MTTTTTLEVTSHDEPSNTSIPLGELKRRPVDTHNLDEPIPQHDVYLVRYMLSYSASCPWLLSFLVRAFEGFAPPSWLAHYALKIDNLYFDLYREGILPFASIAYFRVVNGNDEHQMRQAFGGKPKWIEQDLWLGTVAMHPEDIVSRGIVSMNV